MPMLPLNSAKERLQGSMSMEKDSTITAMTPTVLFISSAESFTVYGSNCLFQKMKEMEVYFDRLSRLLSLFYLALPDISAVIKTLSFLLYCIDLDENRFPGCLIHCSGLFEQFDNLIMSPFFCNH